MRRLPPKSTRNDTLYPSTTLCRSLARAVAADDAHGLALPHLQVDPAQRPELAVVAPPVAHHSLQQAMRGALVDVISEEHTSELQSLMRISYAVYCLKKKHNI